MSFIKLIIIMYWWVYLHPAAAQQHDFPAAQHTTRITYAHTYVYRHAAAVRVRPRCHVDNSVDSR